MFSPLTILSLTIIGREKQFLRNESNQCPKPYASGILTNASFHHDKGKRVYPIIPKITPLVFGFI